jgi:hypothetical protein
MAAAGGGEEVGAGAAVPALAAVGEAGVGVVVAGVEDAAVQGLAGLGAVGRHS